MKTAKNIFLIILVAVAFVLIVNWLLRLIGGMQPPIHGKVTSPYGNRVHPITGVVKFHNGVDIAAAHGTKVVSPASGTISKVYTDNDLGGKQIVIKHDNGYTTGYAHLSEFKVKVGDRVKRGQLIGLTGSTGRVTGPHLHLTVRDSSGYVNPAKIFPQYG